jgi:hypothetical protein
MAERDGVVNVEDVAWTEQAHGERYAVRRKQLGAGGRALGCSLFELPAGKRGRRWSSRT